VGVGRSAKAEARAEETKVWTDIIDLQKVGKDQQSAGTMEYKHCETEG